MDANNVDPIVLATVALVIATLVSGGISALAVWYAAKRSEKILEKQFQSNREQHREQLESDNRQQ